MTSRPIKFAALFLWLAAMAWLVRYEAFPEWFTHVFGGYRSLFADGQFVADSWMQIFFQDQVVGYSHTWLDAQPENSEDTYAIRNRTIVVINLLGERHVVNIMTMAWLDDQYRLRRFGFAMSSGQYRTRIEGRRITEQSFRVEVTGAAETRSFSVDIPENAVLYSPMTELALARLRPGQSLTISTLDPVTLMAANLHAIAKARETIIVDGRTNDALKVEIDFQGVSMTTWIDSEGRALRQETPMGWVMEARSSETVDTTRFDAGASADMMSAFAVQCSSQINRPREASGLELRMHVPAGVWTVWSGPRQSARLENETIAMLQLREQQEPKQSKSLAEISLAEGCKEFLAASPFIQADNPQVLGMARIIIGNETNAWAAACAIHDWVFAKIEKTTAISLPSALDVLKERKGDCNEHTYLFVALARAAGIPARVHVGLVYQNNAFYYHAWPAVFVGEWIEMDPTFGQRIVDATHITLLTGELQVQIRLAALFGRLFIDVVGEDVGPRHPAQEDARE